MSKLSDIYHFLALSDRLWTSGQPTREQFSLLSQAGVKTVINLALDTSSNALPDEPGVVKGLGMEYIHIPVIWEHPTRDKLDEFFLVLAAQGDQKVLVHCAANMRVSAFVALYRIKRLGWQPEKAFQDTYRLWDPFKDEVWGEFVKNALEH